MRKRPEGWNIILAGFWNRMIFTPEWVAERVFHQQDFDTYVAILPVFPVIFTNKSVSMEVSLARLLFRPQNLKDDADLSRAEGMAGEVLKALPETPLQAVGVNFSYVEDFPPDQLTAVFNDNDPREFDSMGWAIKERKLTRKMNKEGDTLNLTMTYDGKAVTFDLNYHFDAANNEAASQVVGEGRAAALRRQSLELLETAYILQLEEDGDEDDV